jgi:hypothetical protein
MLPPDGTVQRFNESPGEAQGSVKAISTRCTLSATQKSMKGLIKAIVAGALIWVAIILVALGYQPAHAGSVVSTVEIGLSLVVAILACVILR